MKKPKSLTIDRQRWLRGEGALKSRLLRSSDGKMCCLGFYALACGATPDQIRDEADPFGLNLPGLRTYRGSETTWYLMKTNDEANKEGDRERLMREGFAEIGVKVRFTR